MTTAGHRCRLCSTNDPDGLVEHLAEAMWTSRREEGPTDIGPWEAAGDHWQHVMRSYAREAVYLLHGALPVPA